MIQINRFTGGEQTYFGSSIKHSGGISISIHTASLERSLNRDSHFTKNKLIEVWMSHNQFAEMLTANMNTSGTPCTLKRVNDETMPSCEFDSKRLQFDKEIKDDMKDIGNKMDHLTETTDKLLNSKKAINQKERQVILSEIAMLRQEIVANVPFIQSQLNEQMDKTIAEAKGEIEGFYEEKIRRFGIKALEDKVKKPEIE